MLEKAACGDAETASFRETNLFDDPPILLKIYQVPDA